MNALVTGAGGQLGEALVEQLSAGHQVSSFSKQQLDLTNPEQITGVLEGRDVDVVVNAAAYTDVDGAETNVRGAFDVNAIGVKRLVESLPDAHTRFLHISTDFVFDGRSDDLYRPEDGPSPINTYGITKRAGEQFAQYHDPWTIIRTASLFGGKGSKHQNFVHTIIDLAENRETLQVVDDQVTSPTPTWLVAEYIEEVIESEISGLQHFTTTGTCSWYQFASEIVEQLDLGVRVQSIPTEQLNQKAKRPKNPTMANSSEVPDRLQVHWREAFSESVEGGN